MAISELVGRSIRAAFLRAGISARWHSEREGKLFPWLHGRAWFSSADEGRRRPSARVEWVFPSAGCRVSVEANRTTGEWLFGVAFPPLSLWLGVEMPSGWWPKQHREWSIRIHNRAIWWRFGQNPHEWHSKTPKWLDGSWHPERTFLGKWVFTEKLLEQRRVLIPLPEGTYPATVKMTDEVRGYARSPFKHRQIGATVEFDDGWAVPFSGKGENSYDCGEDGMFSSSMPARTVEEAIGKVVGSILRTRRSRGDPEKWPTYPPKKADAA